MEITYLLLLQQVREATGGVFDSTMLQITALGESMFTFLLLAFIYWCVDKQAGVYMAGNVGLACTYNQFLKGIFKVERPWIADTRITPVEGALVNAGGYSFPSGHTARAASNWGALGTYYRKRNKTVCYLGWSVALLVAFSRNYLGVHTSWDILGALALTGASMWLISTALNWCKGGSNRDIWVCAVGCLLCVLPMLKAGCLSNAGAGVGACIGWLLERRFVKFDPGKDDVMAKVLRFAVGAAGILYILTAFSALLNMWMPSKYVGFFKMFVVMMFILVIYPFFFVKSNRYRVGAIMMCIILLLTGVGVKARDKKMEDNTGDNTGRAENAEVPLIIAHRGYSSQFPENTLAAFAGAVDIGADMIELDVQLSKDGVVMVYHDNDLARIGLAGSVGDYSCEELQTVDVGGAFSAEYSGERMPTLAGVLEFMQDTEQDIYLELKDIGEIAGFEDAVLAVTDSYQMTSRCIFASFNQQYLVRIKEIAPQVRTIYNTREYDVTLPQEVVSDCYGLYYANCTQEVVDAIHEAGKIAYVYTVDDPEDISAVCAMGVDGIVTNCPGRAKIVVEPQYAFLAESYAESFTMPGLYGADMPAICEDVVVQGMTYAEGYLLVTAYSKSGANSILYVLDSSGEWLTTFDLGFRAHTGGIAFDDVNQLIWITGAEGNVYALEWRLLAENIPLGTKAGILNAPPISYSFDAGLTNHNNSKVASFLDIVNGRLYVGSYVIGREGRLKGYDISAPAEPLLVTEQNIPEKIQGMTLVGENSGAYLLLSQSAQTDESALLVYQYDEQAESYSGVLQTYLLPEGAEQLEAVEDKVLLLFESAAIPYKETARIRNDQIYAVRLWNWMWE